MYVTIVQVNLLIVILMCVELKEHDVVAMNYICHATPMKCNTNEWVVPEICSYRVYVGSLSISESPKMLGNPLLSISKPLSLSNKVVHELISVMNDEKFVPFSFLLICSLSLLQNTMYCRIVIEIDVLEYLLKCKGISIPSSELLQVAVLLYEVTSEYQLQLDSCDSDWILDTNYLESHIKNSSLVQVSNVSLIRLCFHRSELRLSDDVDAKDANSREINNSHSMLFRFLIQTQQSFPKVYSEPLYMLCRVQY